MGKTKCDNWIRSLHENKNRQNIKISTAWRSSSLYASGWKIHDFASPPRDGFAFSTYHIIVLVRKTTSWV